MAKALYSQAQPSVAVLKAMSEKNAVTKTSRQDRSGKGSAPFPWADLVLVWVVETLLFLCLGWFVTRLISLLGINLPAEDTISRSIQYLLIGLVSVAMLALASVLAPVIRRRRRLSTWRSGQDPYLVGPIITDPDKFYGREDALTELIRALEAGNHVALYGERRIGKTSLLHQLAHRLRQMTDAPYQYVPAFVSVQMVPEARFFYALMSAIAKAAGAYTGPLNLLMDERPDRFDSLDLADDLEVLVAALQRANRRPPRIVLLLDEADRMNDYDPHTQEALRGLLMTPVGGHVKLVWSGQTMNREWHLESSPWYNLFKQEIHLGGLEEEAAVRLIREPVKGVFTYEDEAIQRILELTDRKPYPIQRLCSLCVRRLLAENRFRITTDDVEAAWQEVQAEDARRAAEGAVSSSYEVRRPALTVAEERTEYHTGKEDEP